MGPLSSYVYRGKGRHVERESAVRPSKLQKVFEEIRQGKKEALQELVRLADPRNGWQYEYRSLVQWFSLKKNRLVERLDKEEF